MTFPPLLESNRSVNVNSEERKTMAVQPKPLRFLYSKYAGQVPKGGKGCGPLEQVHSTEGFSRRKKSESLSNLHLLGREVSKLERIQMFFAMSEDPCECPSLVNSSVGSASTQGRSTYSRKEGHRVSPSRFRSRSQEFQSMYRLAASRCSLENMKQTSQPGSGNSRVTHLPKLNVNNHSQENDKSPDMKDAEDTRGILKVMIEERKAVGNHLVKPVGITNYHLVECDVYGGAKTPSIHSATSSRGKHRAKNYRVSRAPAEQRPRTSSTVDMDRLDSSCYQYLLDDITSLSSSSTIRSAKSDPASSKASARAQRPSTSGTVGTAQRLRDLHTRTTTTEHSTSTGPPPQPSNFKSPDLQWPPRYAIIPSWPSYEDIQTLNSCGEHRDIMTRLYKKDGEGKYGRRSRDRGHRVNFWNGERDSRHNQNKKVHIVPSHTSMECAMCNLYRHNHEATMCPPNTPLVTSHDCIDDQSRLSTNNSLKVNHSNATAPSTRSSGRLLRSSSDLIRPTPIGNPFRLEDTYSAPPRADPHSLPHSGKEVSNSSNSKSYSKQRNKGVSYSWDTCKLTYVKAHA